MTYKEIQEALRKKGITQREIAQKAGVSEIAISLFIRRKFKSRKLSTMVNRILGTHDAI